MSSPASLQGEQRAGKVGMLILVPDTALQQTTESPELEVCFV